MNDPELIRSINRAEAAVAQIGDYIDRYNAIVADNRYLQSRQDALDARITKLSQQIDDLSSLLLTLVAA